MKIFKYAIYSALFAVVLSSCKKDLDLLPTDSITPGNAFRTLDDAQLAVNGAYGRYSAALNTIYATSLVTDEAKLGKDNAGQGALTYRYQYSSDPTTGGDVTGGYSGFYFVIDQANRVLGALPNVTIAPGEETRRNTVKGQMLALRAIAHFDLLQSFAKSYSAADPKGIPYMTVSDPAAKPARLTVGAVVTNIENDLQEAYSLSPNVTGATFSDTVLNKISIDAYRAKVALYKGDYQGAITYASNVINSNVRPLASGSTFADIWTDNNTSAEVLFRTRLLTSSGLGGLYTTTSGLIYIAPSDKLRNSYSSDDIRLTSYIGGSGPDAYYVNKYYQSSRGGRIVDIKNARIAEMYLIRAEAYAKLPTPNIAAGTADLNLLRTNRITGYINESFASAGLLLTAVIEERFKELAFEGSRLFDLKRNGLPVQRAASDVGSASWQTLPAGNYRFVLPIPQFEMLANPNMVQNDGY